MKFLFPHKYKKIGWYIFSVGIILGIVYLVRIALNLDQDVLQIPWFVVYSDSLFAKEAHLTIVKLDMFDELILVLIIVGSILVNFSRQQNEDEYINKLRLESLVWATYVNYSVILFSILFIHGFSFLWVTTFNLFTILLFFMIRFHWVLHRVSKVA